jgi:hypothetical protein
MRLHGVGFLVVGGGEKRVLIPFQWVTAKSMYNAICAGGALECGGFDTALIIRRL